ncbi:MAG: maleylpyruvate isomerase family mycothiol-dependent enzyme [Actinophytocola sp.]|uniref:maleylpyruvate isomerase family mycothiol-dependent enzyme n=1 Tax=Actinophytocola sp. TaxID=1872138 RepID=UPI001322E557|nr:maleylpyruvate isomerase family mycothiol-dependent enzyme [Actinophytocola sp.]MPZ85597.1 maleylpyruvate isomerase family mycothiol-dependent enzyme [Actinophytocola sp.]
MIAKDAVVPVLVAEWASIDELLGSLGDAQWTTPTALPGWSVQDNVSHIIGTECALTGETPPPCAADVRGFSHVRNDIGAANEHWVQGLRGESPTTVLERFRAITAVRRKVLEAMSQKDFDAPSWTPAGQGTYGRFIRIRLFDCWMHEQDIRDAVGMPGNDGGRCAEGALSEVVSALGYIVGKRAGAPNGATVTIELTGPVRLAWHIAVDGRAKVVDELPGPATATVRLSSNLLTRLAGGRVPVESRIEEIGFGGDTDLGRRVAFALPFTI